ncbi:MAG TPA: hypothetical protein PK224_05470 [Nitrospira sp.]|nr:hypothetical protein [Nitrospira sp.]
MRKIVAKKTEARNEKSATPRRAKQRAIEPATHTIKRKPSTGSSAATAQKKRVKKQDGKMPNVVAKRASSSTRRAKTIGRAVGKILGRVIGTVEQTVAKVIPRPKSPAPRKTGTSR